MEHKGTMESQQKKIEAQTALPAEREWLNARAVLSEIQDQIFSNGSGYGDPAARQADMHRLDCARQDEERTFRNYQHQQTLSHERQLLNMQRASFFLGAVISIATIAQIVSAILK